MSREKRREVECHPAALHIVIAHNIIILTVK